MRRSLALLPLALLLAGCPSYDRYSELADADGLVPADRFARYGTEQAAAIAIGRAFGIEHIGTTPVELDRAIGRAKAYAESLAEVAAVTTDADAFILTVTFQSGWIKAITPIRDDVAPDRTANVPARR